MDKSHKNSFTTKRQILFNSEFEFCALGCIMLMDKVTGCAKLYSQFGIIVSASQTIFQKLLQKHYRAKDYLSPCVVSIKVI